MHNRFLNCFPHCCCQKQSTVLLVLSNTTKKILILSLVASDRNYQNFNVEILSAGGPLRPTTVLTTVGKTNGCFASGMMYHCKINTYMQFA